MAGSNLSPSSKTQPLIRSARSTKKLAAFTGSDFIRTSREHYQQILFQGLNQGFYLLYPEPSLILPLPGYVPPNQNDARNRFGISRSKESARLRNDVLNTVRTREALWDKRKPAEPRFVFVTTWKKGRLMDRGNYVQSCKALLDALHPHFIKDDTPHWCHDHYDMRLASKDRMPVGTLVMIWRIKSLREGIRVSFAE